MALSRRRFVKGLGMGALGLGLGFVPAPAWHAAPRKRDAVPTLNTARNLIFVLLQGGPSHVDTFDFKQGEATPLTIFDPINLPGGHLWPAGTMPLLAEMTDKFSIVKSISAAEAVHGRAVYHLLTAHRENPALRGDVPHFGSILAHKARSARLETDVLPSFLMMGNDPARNGFLPVSARGVELADDGSLPFLVHQYNDDNNRLNLLSRLVEEHPANNQVRRELFSVHSQAKQMMTDGGLVDIFSPKEDEVNSVISVFLNQVESAVQILGADRGTRFVQIDLGDWDHHANIYAGGEFRVMCRAFDIGMARLLNLLEATPAPNGRPGTLLDETMVVAMGEFGRTVGRLNSSLGRDHYPGVTPAFFAGGGVQPGRIIGSTNDIGGLIMDRGWSRNRLMTVNDVAATMYSALGVDWTEGFSDIPSSRNFEIIDTGDVGEAAAIDALFV